MRKYDAPIIREPRSSRDDRDPVHSFLRSRAARIGAAATGAALLATRLSGIAAAYDDGGGAAKWMADDGHGHGAFWWDAADKKNDNKQSNNNQKKNDDRSHGGQKNADKPQQPAKPQQQANNDRRDRDDDSGERKRTEERQRNAENEKREHEAREHAAEEARKDEARKQAAREWAAKVEAEKRARAEHESKQREHEQAAAKQHKNDGSDGGQKSHGGGQTVSNKDENTQGKSHSNPDGGGVDKPFPADGQPAKSQGKGDHDGNNGSGNDDDCSDDNNGNGPKHCGPNEVVAGEQAKNHDKHDKTSGLVRDDSVVVKSDDDTCVIVIDDKVHVRDNWHLIKHKDKDHNQNVSDDDKSPTGASKSETGSPTTTGTVAGVRTIKDDDQKEKVVVCHATGSKTNPFVRIEIDKNGLHGHGNHEGDIVNPTGDCPAPEAVAGEQATPTDAPTPTKTPVPTQVVKDDDACTDDAATGDSSPSAVTNGTNTSHSAGTGKTNCVVVSPTATATTVPTTVAGEQATPSPTVTPDDDQKAISATALIEHECVEGEWHFIINGLKDALTAPASITVRWANGATETVPLEKTSGDAAHYTTTANLDSPVTGATANIAADWGGNFNLSHGPCIEAVAGVQATPTPTDTPVPTAAGDQATPTDDDDTSGDTGDTSGVTTAGTTANTTVQAGGSAANPTGTSGTVAAIGAGGTQSGIGTVGGTLADVQPGDIDQAAAEQIAGLLGGGLVASDVQALGGDEITALAGAAGVELESVEAVLGESVTRDAPGEVWIEDVLGAQARQTYENVVAGAMASTGGAPVGPVAVGLAALGGIGVALRRFTRRPF
jgi:hypothetical protein